MPKKSKRPNSKRAIQNAAVELFFRKGYGATSVREIAGKAGVQVATVYNHYRSKQLLLVEILIDRETEQYAILRKAVDAEGEDAVERLRAFVRVKISEQKRPISETTILDSELRSIESKHRPFIMSIRDSQDELLNRILADGVTQNCWPPPGSLAKMFIFQATDIRRWYRPKGCLSLNQIATECLDFVLNGLNASREK